MGTTKTETNLLDEWRNLQTLAQFVHDHKKNAGITKATADQIETLFNKYKKTTVESGDNVVTVEAGKFGNVCVRNVLKIDEPFSLKYESGNYDMVSIRAKEHTTLWTDFDHTEPYNRQSPFYVGCSFKNMSLVRTELQYREFINDTREINICFGVWGFMYNNFWDSVNFGICLKSSDTAVFIAELRKLLNKP